MNKAGFFLFSSLLCLSLLTSQGRAAQDESGQVDKPPSQPAQGTEAPQAESSKTEAPAAKAEEKLPPLANLSFEESYKAGVQAYQAKQYDKARDAFAKALEKDPHNPSAMTNLALAQFKLNQKGWAIGLFRKSLELDPEQATAKAGLKFALSQLEIKEIPHQIETYESIRSQFLQPVTLNIYLFLTALFFFAAGWTLFSYIGKRRKALQAEDALPGFPLISFLLGLGFLTTLSLTLLKFYDASLTRGTIVAEKVSVQAAPGENQVMLFDLYTGFEVLVRHVDKEWIQVTYPGASTGWVKKSSVLVTSGKEL